MQRLALRTTILLCLALFTAAPSWATELDCPDDKLIYREDMKNRVGWFHQVTEEGGTPAVVRFVFDKIGYMDIEHEGKVTRLVTTSGGTGIRMRAAYRKDSDDQSVLYAFYDIEGRVPKGQPDYFLIVGHDLFWPECEK